MIGVPRLTPAQTVWLKRTIAAAAIALIAVQWINTRVSILRVNQFSPQPVVLTTYYIFHSMATGLKEGRIGQVDIAALQRHANLHGNDPWAPFERIPPGEPHRW